MTLFACFKQDIFKTQKGEKTFKIQEHRSEHKKVVDPTKDEATFSTED